MNVGMVQRCCWQTSESTPDTKRPITQRLSDLQLLGATTVIPNWTLDGTLQLSAIKAPHRTRHRRHSLLSPSPFRTIGLSYLYTRNSERASVSGLAMAHRQAPPVADPDAPRTPGRLTGQRCPTTRVVDALQRHLVRRGPCELQHARQEGPQLFDGDRIRCEAAGLAEWCPERVSVGQRPIPASCSSWSWWACLALVQALRALRRDVPGYRLLQTQ